MGKLLSDAAYLHSCGSGDYVRISARSLLWAVLISLSALSLAQTANFRAKRSTEVDLQASWPAHELGDRSGGQDIVLKSLLLEGERKLKIQPRARREWYKVQSSSSKRKVSIQQSPSQLTRISSTSSLKKEGGGRGE